MAVGTKNLTTTVVMVVVLMVVVAAVMMEKSEAAELCKMNDDGLKACKPSVTDPNPTEPSEECCQALSGADLECLCSYKNSFLLPSMGINPKLAMALPAKCNLTPPPDC